MSPSDSEDEQPGMAAEDTTSGLQECLRATPWPFLFQRVMPPQTGKAVEVPVVGMNFTVLFQGDGRDMGVCRQSAGNTRLIEKLGHNIQMSQAGFQDGYSRGFQPFLYQTDGFPRIHRFDHDSVVRHDSYESNGDNPW